MPPKMLEEEKQSTGHLRVQVIEESKSKAFMAAKVDDPVQRREQMAGDRPPKEQEAGASVKEEVPHIVRPELYQCT